MIGSDSAAAGGDAAGGSYTLVVELTDDATLDAGALGAHALPAGAYAYTGSALGSGGFSRVDRHRRTARGEHDVRHWHVDYLLGDPAARVDRVVRSVGADVECAVAERLPAGPVPGFGAADCGCRSHLTAEPDREGSGRDGALDALAAVAREAHEAAVAEPNAGAGLDADATVEVVGGSDAER